MRTTKSLTKRHANRIKDRFVILSDAGSLESSDDSLKFLVQVELSFQNSTNLIRPLIKDDKKFNFIWLRMALRGKTRTTWVDTIVLKKEWVN